MLSAIIIGMFSGMSSGFYIVMTIHIAVNSAAQFCLIGVINRYYWNEVRATGVGYLMGAGRLGALSGPLTGGTLVATGLSINTIYALTAIPAAIGCLALVYLNMSGRLRATRGG